MRVSSTSIDIRGANYNLYGTSNWVSHVTMLLGPGGWIELSYGNGTQYSSHCGQSGRVARLLFDCDPFAGKVTTQYNGMCYCECMMPLL